MKARMRLGTETLRTLCKYYAHFVTQLLNSDRVISATKLSLARSVPSCDQGVTRCACLADTMSGIPPVKKAPAAGDAPAPQIHKIRITLSSRNPKALEKGSARRSSLQV